MLFKELRMIGEKESEELHERNMILVCFNKNSKLIECHINDLPNDIGFYDF